MSKSKDAEAARRALKEDREVETPWEASDLLSTGSTLLNLACTGKSRGGFIKGKYFFVVGDSSSGKTFLTLTCMAEAAINKSFDGYRFIYDDVEGGALMDFERFFGKEMASRVEPPARGADGEPVYSETIEDMYFGLHDAIEDGRPFIWVEDSMDALSSKYEGKKFDEKKKEARGGKKAKGDYGDGKAAINSRFLRKILSGLRDTGSILILIGQTRDNIDAGLFEPKKTRSGGWALKFYSCLEMWSSVRGKLTREVRGKKRQIGINAAVKVKKNRLTGKDREIVMPIYWSMGIDDLGSCVDYLIDEGHWKTKGKTGIVLATDFDMEHRRDRLIHEIEEQGLERDLRELVGVVWEEVERACEVKRKPRY
jgi:RecA/RadA recombinase